MLDELGNDWKAADDNAGCYFRPCLETHDDYIVGDIW
jgi:hypothetical protein